ncbi:polysaccharide deacetylase family protein [Sporosarcina trichiuri]|uniref:polysaccharide deacetylase family protein n=1 Tax=Sporosarcina trichiuri TaxID=3056445 RepID=UPI0025B4F295|nr:polysaccharide deacetylase family protein [Sporosarcina sp. 0.2-SM1T-5]WJY26335.1 polysaccharide deacetylase family protein [Sporosarcina sp. 0.2-SM1T-5]
MKKRLNRKGRVLSILLAAVVLLLAVGLLLPYQKEGNEQDARTAALGTLTVSAAPLAEFKGSAFRQSVVEKHRRDKEAARKEAVAKQNAADAKERAIYLTFDDGPSSHVNQLLDLLDQYQMKATFFMLGPNIKEYPDSLKRMEKSGHGLALHGITHQAGKIYSGPETPAKEMADDRDIVKQVTGVTTNIVRLPYGSIPYLTEEMRDELDKEDFHVWDWHVDSRDWELKDQRFVQHTIDGIRSMTAAGVAPVILLHDKPATIQHLPALLAYIKKEGYKTKVITNDTPPVTFQCEGRCYAIK